MAEMQRETLKRSNRRSHERRLEGERRRVERDKLIRTQNAEMCLGVAAVRSVVKGPRRHRCPTITCISRGAL